MKTKNHKNHLLVQSLFSISMQTLYYLSCVLIILYLTVSCAVVKFVKINHVIKNIDAEKFYRDTVDVMYRDHLYLHATINDSISGWFILDTGAPTILFGDYDFGRKYVKIDFSGLNSSQSSYIHKNNTLRIGETTFERVPIIVINSSLDTPNCQKPAVLGIIGHEILRKGVWQLNYAKQQIIISDNSDNLFTDKKTDFHRSYLPQYSLFSRETEIKLFNLLGKDQHKYLIIDTGFIGSILMPKDSATAIEQPLYRRNDLKSPVTDTNGITVEKEIQIDYVYSNEFENKHGDTLSIMFMDLPEVFQTRYEGLVGNALLENFIITLDNPKKQLVLQRQKSLFKPVYSYGINYSYTNEGIYYIYYIDSTLIDQSLIPLVSVGDSITSINGLSPKKGHCEINTNLPKKVTFDLVNGKKSISITLERRTIFGDH